MKYFISIRMVGGIIFIANIVDDFINGRCIRCFCINRQMEIDRLGIACRIGDFCVIGMGDFLIIACLVWKLELPISCAIDFGFANFLAILVGDHDCLIRRATPVKGRRAIIRDTIIRNILTD